MSKCNCFEERLESVKPKIMAQIPTDAIDVDVEWENYSFFFGGGDYSPVNPQVKIEYRPLKKDKSPAKNLKKDTVSLLASHCCFCGRKLEN